VGSKFLECSENELTDFTKLGPLGDIYGSLNTIVSSIALCAIAFTTYLQVISLKQEKLLLSKWMNLEMQFLRLNFMHYLTTKMKLKTLCKEMGLNILDVKF
jgi:hypothetical protein